MTEKELYVRVDEILGAFLVLKGFQCEQAGRYARKSSGGEDRISVSIGHPAKFTPILACGLDSTRITWLSSLNCMLFQNGTKAL